MQEIWGFITASKQYRITENQFQQQLSIYCQKNSHEMAGLFLVYILVFTSDEGPNVLLKTLGEERLAAFIHCFETMLFLEIFCKSHQHERKDLSVMKQGIPAILDFLKKTINRTKGNGMKIIKYHLCLHHVDDIRRFGSMRNYDSCIGERHHCTEVKKPSKNTQRRKCNFEFQTAQRYVENVVISKALSNFPIKTSSTKNIIVNRNNSIIYERSKNEFFKKDYKTKKFILCDWQDKQLKLQLIN